MRPDDIFWRLHFFLPATLGARRAAGARRLSARHRIAVRAGTRAG